MPMAVGDIYYEKNNKIVHYSELDADMYWIAHRWCQYVLSAVSMDKIYFNILGINCNKLLSASFGGKKKFIDIYDRFFRTALIYPLKKYFDNKSVIIDNIFHEVGDQEFDQYFPWYTIFKLNEDTNLPIRCQSSKIQFIGKDHNLNERANFIQLIDLILGVTRNSFDNTTNDKFKIKITDDFIGLVKRLSKYPNNINSHYCPNSSRRMNIDFFPERKLNPKSDLYEYAKYRDQFYKDRPLLFLTRKQLLLL
jgi:hypothetical protein